MVKDSKMTNLRNQIKIEAFQNSAEYDSISLWNLENFMFIYARMFDFP